MVISLQFVNFRFFQAVTVYYLCGQTALKYNDYIYPAWAQAIAYLMSASSIAMIPGYAIYKIIKARKDGKSVRQVSSFKEVLKTVEVFFVRCFALHRCFYPCE